MSTQSQPSPAVSVEPVTEDELAAHLAALDRPDAALLAGFGRLFHRRFPRHLPHERTLEELAAMTEGAWAFLQASGPGRAGVQLVDPRDEGWSTPVSVLRTCIEDRPFIVDSIREYLNAERIPILQYIYPVLRVVRDEAGRIVEIGDGTAAHDHLEALAHCEIPHVPDPARREEIRREVERRLADVVEATSDFRAMIDALARVRREVMGYAHHFPEHAREYAEYAEFLRWLGENNFVFLGFRAYDIAGAGAEAVVQVEPGSGLGILANEGRSSYSRPVPLSVMQEDFRRRVTGGSLLLVSKANRESTVHRRARMDYVGVKKLDAHGNVAGEWRFLGLFTSAAYAQSPAEIPVLRHKIREILQLGRTRPGSHDYKETLTILQSMPKEELFAASVEELLAQTQAVLAHLFSDEVRVSLRPDALRREVSAMVILPRGRYSAEIRRRVAAVLERRLDGTVASFHLAMGAGDQARLHFYLSTRGAALAGGLEWEERAIEREVHLLVRSWEEKVAEALAEVMDGAEAARLARAYGEAFGDEYRAATTPASAMHDVLRMEAMEARGARVDIHVRTALPDEPIAPGCTSLRFYVRDERVVLSDFIPLLEHAGVRVVEVDTFEALKEGRPWRLVYAFAVQTREGQPIPDEHAVTLAELLMAGWAGDAVRDGYNGLVLACGLRWREADVIRAYGSYAAQIGAVPNKFAPIRAFQAHPRVTRLILDLFRARFDPAAPAGPARLQELRAALARELEAVTSLADDRALRKIAALVDATVRTNYFRHGGASPTARSGGAPYLSLKIRSADVEELRRSRLLYEVFVHSSRMDGIHLRGAAVSRGGIRWSDRPDDFRTEVLGLVTTQVVKNATIVPSGSKGGFVLRRTPADREALMAEAADQYRTLIRGLLDITDNLVDGAVVPPPGVVRHDGDDPYLVVAADKGTAHLSDVANAVAAEYGFWLGDAFASGGSHGYDHKKEGITARGAWECVKRHFREMGKDIQATPFTVAGIGDMSGDVFGNGMLLSRQIRLIAAFDHRHVFIDPDPDPAVSFAERERMFALPRSSWDDYDRSTLSTGAMIVPRASKAVELTPEARRALGLPDDVERLDGEQLVRAVLLAPVELLWNGGIGTYVKDREETHADVGDTTNDPVRVNADELRCRVLGEGGNLGLTQRARIAFGLRGGRLNTDALDNSAGVDMSDHEVNLKILLNPVVAAGRLDADGRNALLARMTDEVSELVLRNNVGQSLAVSLDAARSTESLDDFSALIVALERDRRLDRAAEGIPDAEEIRDRARARIGLTRPTHAVLLSHAKLYAKSALLESDLPDDPATAAFLAGYFPAEAVAVAGEEGLAHHRLRREIVTTELVNDLVNLMGASFLHRMARDSGRGLAEVVRAWLVASRLAGAAEIRAELARPELELRYRSETVYRWLAGLARVLEQTTQWLLDNEPATGDTQALIDARVEGLKVLRGGFARFVAGADRALFLARLGELGDLGVSRTLAERLITLRFLPQLLECLHVARTTGAEPLRAGRAYYAVAETFETGALREAVRGAAGDDPWNRRFALALEAEVAVAQRDLVAHVLARADETGPALKALERERAVEIGAYRALLGEVRAEKSVPLAAYALVVRQLRMAAA